MTHICLDRHILLYSFSLLGVWRSEQPPYTHTEDNASRKINFTERKISSILSLLSMFTRWDYESRHDFIMTRCTQNSLKNGKMVRNCMYSWQFFQRGKQIFRYGSAPLSTTWLWAWFALPSVLFWFRATGFVFSLFKIIYYWHGKYLCYALRQL